MDETQPFHKPCGVNLVFLRDDYDWWDAGDYEIYECPACKKEFWFELPD